MKRLSQILIVGWFLTPWTVSGSALWMNASTNLPELSVRCIAADPLEAPVLFVSSEKRLYRSTDSGKTWKQVLSLRGGSDAINALYVSKENGKRIVYVATNQGVKVSYDSGKTWAWFYRGQSEASGKVLCLLPSSDGRLFVGTAQGLIQVNARGEKSVIEAAPKTAVYSVLKVDEKPNIIFLSTAQGLYHSMDGGAHWERSFAEHTEKKEGQTLEQFDIEELSSRAVSPALIYFSPAQKVYAGNGSGLLESALDRVSWNALQGQGLAGRSVRCLANTAKTFYVGTELGVYRWNTKTHVLEDASDGLETGAIETLVYSAAEDALYAGGQRGLFKIAHPDIFFEVSEVPSAPDAKMLFQRFQNEPGIGDVQAAAIHYAEVSPGKIEAWRKAAARKAFLPTLSVRGDSSTDQNVDIDRGGTADVDRFIIGPEEKSFDWSVGLSWDLGDLIWNDDQTSIDTRSKLMAELRGDLLNEVTHLYYERRRLQIEMTIAPSTHLPLQIEKEIRLQELTAGIDALTGSYLSKSLEYATKRGE